MIGGFYRNIFVKLQYCCSLLIFDDLNAVSIRMLNCECNLNSKIWEFICVFLMMEMHHCTAKHLRSIITTLNVVAVQFISKVKRKPQWSQIQAIPCWYEMRKYRILATAAHTLLVHVYTCDARSIDPFICVESIFCINYRLNGKYDWVMGSETSVFIHIATLLL